MGALVDLRADLKSALTGKVLVGGVALEVRDILPERFTPPAMLLVPADPFLAPSTRTSFGIAEARWDVLLIVGHGTSPTQAVGIESLVEQALDAIYAVGNDWMLGACSAPFELSTTVGTFLAVRVTVTRPARITST